MNRRDNDGGPFEDTTLEVHTATSWKFALWTFTEAYLKRWTSGWHRWNPQDYEILSRSLCYVLRHVGCTHGQFLGCDSGGWYRLDNFMTILHLYVTEDGSGTKAWRPRWVEELRQRLAGRDLLHGMTRASWMIVLLKAVEPKQHQLGPGKEI